MFVCQLRLQVTGLNVFALFWAPRKYQYNILVFPLEALVRASYIKWYGCDMNIFAFENTCFTVVCFCFAIKTPDMKNQITEVTPMKTHTQLDTTVDKKRGVTFMIFVSFRFA